MARTHRGANLVQGIDGIDRGGARRFQRLVDDFDLRLEPGEAASSKCPQALRQAVGGGGADRPRPAHHHVVDGARGLAKVEGGDDPKFVRQKALLDEQDRVALRVKGNRAEMARAAADSDVHGEE